MAHSSNRQLRVVVLVLLLNHLLFSKFSLPGVDAFLAREFGLAAVVHKHKPPISVAAPSSSSPPCFVSLSRTTMLHSSSLLSSSSSSEFQEKKKCASGDNNSEHDEQQEKKNRKKRYLYSFSEARKIARGHGFSDKQEFMDYDCAGAYQVPKNADEVWFEDWTSWDDFLGTTLNDFETAREVARTRVGCDSSSTTRWKACTEEEYLHLFKTKQIDDADIASRLPYRPDLFYKNKGWVSWEDFLSKGNE